MAVWKGMPNHAQNSCKLLGMLHSLVAYYNFLGEKIYATPQKNKVFPFWYVMEINELETSGTGKTDRGFIDQASCDCENVGNEILFLTIGKR